MNTPNTRKNPSWLLAILLTSASAFAREGALKCGTPDGATPLGKSAELPKVSRNWSGTLKVLVLRVGFSDAPYSVDAADIGTTNAQINALYQDMSRNTFAWDWRLHGAILNAPGTTAEYGADIESLKSWITARIRDAGLQRGTDYDVYVANFPEVEVDWAGQSNLRDADWINGSYSAGVVGHELGHSLGLSHAHSIEAGADMFGTPGTASQANEYGNPFDLMGMGGAAQHFNVVSKWRIGWEDADEIQEAKVSGTYRIYAHDNGRHKSHLIGLRVPAGNPDYGYWFEYRAASAATRNGAIAMFQGFRTPANPDAWFLDATPGSIPNGIDEADGDLSVGRSFRDKYGGTTFQTVAVNSGTWNEGGWVDVRITIPNGTALAWKKDRTLLPFGQAGIPCYDAMGRGWDGKSAAPSLSIRFGDYSAGPGNMSHRGTPLAKARK